MNYAIVFNGVFESVLEEIITAQNINDDLTCFLQPYSSRTIVKLKNDQPSAESPITAYFSITTELSKILYKGNIVGWENKQQLSPERLSYLNNHIKEHQPDEEEIYMRNSNDKPCVNLMSVSELIKLEVPIPISNFIKITNNTPLKVKSQSGLWSYVEELPADFYVVQDNDFTPIAFRQGKQYLRKDIIDTYGGQSRSGITTPSRHPLIFLFTSKSGKDFGYDDGWTDDGTFEICGEGQVGDMEFVRGNKAILQHSEEGKELHLFEAVGNGYVRYVSKMVYKSYREDQGPDLNGDMRKRIIFELTPQTSITDNDREFTSTEMVEGKKVLRYTTTYERRSGLKKTALAIHGYDCLACGCNFEEVYGEHGKGFIHVHHVKPLSESGETNVDPKTDLIPLCPNCHAMVHKDKKHTLSLDELKGLIK